ncbi:hypothetical protein BgiMline_013797 [Biomphalaria glabrata]|uniref:Uncharacterized protein LOC106060108 n=1 Tax=Biomphalaria glabrata TaxID=6526 RepID=A0A9W3AHP3_BIOGL|nr:uncharacterized protein LOC106060108 [Biomphalaria glabrata]XP_055886798.1 uncharacterized protein LOC106060108 [Biomphalaria glabrata]XP_055886799.1 uncharacterized protein LOC106060108 [Biomphalaria glabrata]XP_055886800.1 uncharacterized protein LOC106060108 [Biomphalaria glabrata]XP_055886801.1 uncharacterized protein LOC106060108 [Biomphalaria glabrata]XP_055886802.1 uncharacterized protein LOC106060108 [Biomphalaria glabrata]KAI8754135.1 hypothetical protein BgiMline_012601 [Biomphal
MGDAILPVCEILQPNAERNIDTHSSWTAPEQTVLLKRVQFLPDDSLVQVHEISPRPTDSSNSDESSESTESNESESESESEYSTSSTEMDSEDEVHIPIKNRSKSEKMLAKNNKPVQNSNSKLHKGTFNTKNNIRPLQISQPTQCNRKINGDAKPKLSVMSNHSLPKAKLSSAKKNSDSPDLNRSIITSATSNKPLNFNNLSRRSSAPVYTKRNLLPARKSARARRGSEEYKLPSVSSSIMQIGYDKDMLLKSNHSLTIEDGFIFPSLQTYEMRLPELNPSSTYHSANVSLSYKSVKTKENLKHGAASGDHARIRLQSNSENDHRHTAWQMANGRAEDALETKPDIAQLWDSAST